MTTFVNAQQPTTRAFDIFKDTVSEEYSDEFGDGTGYDLCAPQSYEIREVIQNQEGPSDLVTVDSVNRILTL